MVLPLTIVKATLNGEVSITMEPPLASYGVYLYVTSAQGELVDSYTSISFTYDSSNRITEADVTNNSGNTLYCYLVCMGDLL